MKIKGTIYLFAPMEKDLANRKDLREHLSRPTAGRLFLEVAEKISITASIPFSSISHLMQILDKVRLDDYPVFSKKLVPAFNGTSEKELEKRRCLRISIEDINAPTDSMRYASYLGKKGNEYIKYSFFSLNSTGKMTLLDAAVDYKYRKMYFTDFFDAGVKLSKAFSAEVAKRIPLEMKNVRNS